MRCRFYIVVNACCATLNNACRIMVFSMSSATLFLAIRVRYSNGRVFVLACKFVRIYGIHNRYSNCWMTISILCCQLMLHLTSLTSTNNVWAYWNSVLPKPVSPFYTWIIAALRMSLSLTVILWLSTQKVIWWLSCHIAKWLQQPWFTKITRLSVMDLKLRLSRMTWLTYTMRWC